MPGSKDLLSLSLLPHHYLAEEALYDKLVL